MSDNFGDNTSPTVLAQDNNGPLLHLSTVCRVNNGQKNVKKAKKHEYESGNHLVVHVAAES